jgi:SlyX protein
MEERLKELEIRYSLQQDLVQQLSDVIARHDRELAKLRAELDELRARRADDQLPFDPDESPPHY